MKQDIFVRMALTLIALLLGVIALRPFFDPPASRAQVPGSDLYIEPGVHTLHARDGSRELLGKVVVDLRTGNVWGFPTGVNAPYPVSNTQSAPPVSRPFLLAKFELSAMK
jgi:hypothetical protein